MSDTRVTNASHGEDRARTKSECAEIASIAFVGSLAYPLVTNIVPWTSSGWMWIPLGLMFALVWGAVVAAPVNALLFGALVLVRRRLSSVVASVAAAIAVLVAAVAFESLVPPDPLPERLLLGAALAVGSGFVVNARLRVLARTAEHADG